MPELHLGVLGLGVHLPPEVRRNDWWNRAVVDGWMAMRTDSAAQPRAPRTPGEARVIEAMANQARDPFQGAVERRVLDASRAAIDMEEAAAREAIANAGLEPGAIDLLLTDSPVPEHQLTIAACELHERLGLAPGCLTMRVDAAQLSFLAQLTVADALIAAGRARVGLIVQSALASRLLDYRSPFSPLFGDGAAAAVVARVPGGYGLVATHARTDGRFPKMLVASPVGAPWYAGRSVLHVGDPAALREVLLGTLDHVRGAIAEVLAAADLRAADVDVFCLHQGTPWLRALAQDHAGLGHARAVDTFARTGHLNAAQIPSTLAAAAAAGLLRDGDLVAMAGGGTGMVVGAALLRWGRP